MFADTATSVAIKIISGMALGRGASIPLETVIIITSNMCSNSNYTLLKVLLKMCILKATMKIIVFFSFSIILTCMDDVT